MSKTSKLRLILLDIGGTLLNDKNKISLKDQRAIRKAKKDFNVEIAIATARMFSSTKYITNKIKSDYAVFSNGSVVLDLATMNQVKVNYLNKRQVEQIIKFAKTNEIDVHINRLFSEGSDKMDYFTLKHTILNEKYPKKLKNNVFYVANVLNYIKENKISDIVKIVLVSDKNLDEIYEKLQKMLKKENLYITEYYKNSYESTLKKKINYIEIGSVPDNKYLGIKELMKYLKLKSDEVLFIGDGKNDKEVFQNLKNTVCMNNGDEDIKKISSYVTESNNKNGVAKAIYSYLEGENKMNITIDDVISDLHKNLGIKKVNLKEVNDKKYILNNKYIIRLNDNSLFKLRLVFQNKILGYSLYKYKGTRG